ncbi:hypothetical protein QAD02_019238 [Eretmocerus hayati]|uniref:Uncharacterized protein n=1 Tax=Eretmocerus hayati TaxID=131215 RepID=A0ACC2PK85_9HYME|nr:hypothetical protein QAD02_019238 [Eretmocerus hayati]
MATSISLVIGAVLTPEDEQYFGGEADRYDWNAHPCRRDCWHDRRKMRCEYVFVIEQYSSMSKACYDCPYNVTDCDRPHCIAVDGKQKMVYTANRQIPGPSIEVCQGDTIIVDVRNNMLAESTTIHWHGVKQEKTPYMDGVPFVSQCPIHPGDHFQYMFNATETGTYFWHSHIGGQRTDGLYGSLIVHPTLQGDKHADVYAYDHYHMMISDWIHLDANSGIEKEYHDSGGVNPNTLIVNGKGRFHEFKRNNKSYYTPTEIFAVDENKRYRFRLINTGADDCPIRVSFDKHVMTVISLDGKDIEPTLVTAIDSWPGERVDFVIHANQKPDTYWIRLRGFGLCNPGNDEKHGAWQVARLWYQSTKLRDPPSPIGYEYPKLTDKDLVLNPYDKNQFYNPKIFVNIPDLNSTQPDDETSLEDPDYKIYIAFDFYHLDNYDFHRKDLYGYNQVSTNRSIGTMQMNHISLKMPSSPLMSQWADVDESTFCNSSTIKHNQCALKQCACTHVIQVKLNTVVELVLVDEGEFSKANHPLHLHGHFFRVVAVKHLNERTSIKKVMEMDKNKQIHRQLHRAPMKDTMKAPGGGFTIVRFYANNPGYWFFHCHFEQHSNIGMALIFKVGEHEDFPAVPRNFPKCGHYKPSEMIP